MGTPYEAYPLRFGRTGARRQLEIDELQESAHRQLIEALARSGQQSLALAQYDICRNLLQDELGVEPALETQQLMVAVRDGNLKAVSSPFAVRGYELQNQLAKVVLALYIVPFNRQWVVR